MNERVKRKIEENSSVHRFFYQILFCFNNGVELNIYSTDFLNISKKCSTKIFL